MIHSVNIQNFEVIDLTQINNVRLMNRIDRKFCIPVTQVDQLLQSVSNEYYILEIDGEKIQHYHNVYYDNLLDSFYYDHLRGKLNRYKIRVRDYTLSQLSFVEVKFKTNKGKTLKKRVAIDEKEGFQSDKVHEFIQRVSPFRVDELKPVLQNDFYRITLVNKEKDERCTIDLDLKFIMGDNTKNLDDLAIIEVKTEGLKHDSVLIKALRDLHYFPRGFSKYCYGRSVVDDEVQNNAYRLKIRQIDKLIDYN